MSRRVGVQVVKGGQRGAVSCCTVRWQKMKTGETGERRRRRCGGEEGMKVEGGNGGGEKDDSRNSIWENNTKVSCNT